jgi:hypothetical protein
MDRGVPTLGERRDVTRDVSHPLCRTQLRPTAWLRRESPVKILPARVTVFFPGTAFSSSEVLGPTGRGCFSPQSDLVAYGEH